MEEEKVAEGRRGRTSPISCPGSELSSTNLDRSPIAYFAEIRKLDSGRARIEEKKVSCNLNDSVKKKVFVCVDK